MLLHMVSDGKPARSVPTRTLDPKDTGMYLIFPSSKFYRR